MELTGRARQIAERIALLERFWIDVRYAEIAIQPSPDELAVEIGRLYRALDEAVPR